MLGRLRSIERTSRSMHGLHVSSIDRALTTSAARATTDARCVLSIKRENESRTRTRLRLATLLEPKTRTLKRLLDTSELISMHYLKGMQLDF